MDSCNVEVFFVTACDDSYPIRVGIILVRCVMVHMQRVFEKLCLHERVS